MAGAGLASCMEEMQTYLNAELNNTVKFVDIVDHLENKSYRQLMLNPMKKIFDDTSTAISEGITALANSDADINVLGCHLTLYDARSQLFHSPVHAKSLVHSHTLKYDENAEGGTIKPDRIILLIDDIYDMLDSLGGEGDIFDRGKQARATLEDLGQSIENVDQRTKALADLDADTLLLRQILGWRRSEMIAAEALADSLDIPLYLVGTKHPVELARVLFGKKPPRAVYISHPITRHREDHSTSGKWSEDVYSLNRLPRTLAENNILALMPTAIDELRFSKPDLDDVFFRNGGNIPRWPCMDSGFALIGSRRYLPNQTDHRSIESFDEAHRFDPATASAYLRVIENSIYYEIPFRDHYLVNHCNGLLVFRPQENGNSFSGGVIAEIDLFADLAKIDEARRMAVIHDRKDLHKIIERMFAGELRDDYLPNEAVQEYIAKMGKQRLNRRLSRADIASIARRGKIDRSHLSQSTYTDDSMSGLVLDAWVYAAQRTLFSELTGLDGSYAWCQIIVGDTSSPDVLSAAASWFAADNLRASKLWAQNVGLSQNDYRNLALSLVHDDETKEYLAVAIAREHSKTGA